MNTNSISLTLQKKEIISATKGSNLFVFNPEHDLALGVGKGSYTPPAEVIRIRKEKSLLPALFADNGDFILLRDKIENMESLPFFDSVLSKNLNLLSLSDIHNNSGSISKIIPWGWDHAIYNQLSENGISNSLLPKPKFIDNIRRLSHRRTTIPFREKISYFLNEEILNIPQELFSIEEIEIFIEEHGTTFFKAPWSSSGRGIVVSDHIKRKGLMEWCHGVIKHQGSVMAERAWNKVIDFASEWIIRKSEAVFLGLSVFETSSRGKYHRNIDKSQDELYQMIKNPVPNFSYDIIKAQKKTIESLISPYYNGFMGIDMLGDSDGNINPCVELNLRLTMGHIPILRNKTQIF